MWYCHLKISMVKRKNTRNLLFIPRPLAKAGRVRQRSNGFLWLPGQKGAEHHRSPAHNKRKHFSLKCPVVISLSLLPNKLLLLSKEKGLQTRFHEVRLITRPSTMVLNAKTKHGKYTWYQRRRRKPGVKEEYVRHSHTWLSLVKFPSCQSYYFCSKKLQSDALMRENSS